MDRYKNLGNDSGISYYQIEDESISIWFKGNSKIYSYSYIRAGQAHVENMKQLAANGRGLNSYINRYVKHLYD